jgi:glycosyltransferase involved in cell wall biosynthesis
MNKFPGNQKVTVCLPVFNGEQFLSAAIESVLNQTYANLEIIIIDDCSTDSSPEIIQNFAAADNRIKFVRNEANIGLFANYNKCIELATGSFIKPFAQDDLLHGEFVATCLALLQEDPDTALISTARNHIDNNGCLLVSDLPSPPDFFRSTMNICGKATIAASLFPVVNFIGEPAAVMFRREHAGSGFNPTFHQLGDLEFWFRILLKGSYSFVRSNLCSIRLHSNNTTKQNRQLLLHALDVLKLGKIYQSFIEEKAGRTLAQFHDLAIQALAKDLEADREEISALLNGTLDDSSSLDKYAPRRLAKVSPAECLELALHAFTRIQPPKPVDRTAVVRELEGQLSNLLTSRSWRITRTLREANKLLLDPNADLLLAGISHLKQDPNAQAYVRQQKYERYLRNQLWKLKKSRSWQLTKPVRFVEKLLGEQPNSPLPERVPQPAERSRLFKPLSTRALTAPLHIKLAREAEGAKPKVSVIMPTWNRAHLIEQALSSLLGQTYTDWECLIVDDGSTDNTRSVLKPYLQDNRFRYFHQEHGNCSKARNRGLKEARGEIIAYLDTDNIWLPQYLSKIVDAYDVEPEVKAIYTGQIVQERDDASRYFARFEPFDIAKLQQQNFIDLNVFSHRREVVSRLGGFDEQLESLTDWDLLLRIAKTEKMLGLPFTGGIYFSENPDRISAQSPHAHSRFVIESKQQTVSSSGPLKVLYALWHYPQLSETYIEAEIQAVKKMGVDVEVWSETGVAAPYETNVIVHHGSLQDALRLVKPDVIHTHWTPLSGKYDAILREAKIPTTVRAHEFDEECVPLLNDTDPDAFVKILYLFPHHANMCAQSNPKVKGIPVGFNTDLYKPNRNKDRRLVLRAGAALETKGYRTFFKTAMLCPGHKFVLALVNCYEVEHYLDEFVELNKSLGNPVEIVANLPFQKIAELTGRAGIYMHTTDPEGPFGMPISIAEAMATGSYPLLYRRPEAFSYTGDLGAYYSTPQEAAELINNTLHWTDEMWDRMQTSAIEYAYEHFVSEKNYRTIVEDWHRIAGRRPRSPGIAGTLPALTTHLFDSGAPGSPAPCRR